LFERVIGFRTMRCWQQPAPPAQDPAQAPSGFDNDDNDDNDNDDNDNSDLRIGQKATRTPTSTQHDWKQDEGQAQDQDKIGTSKMPRRTVLRTVVEGAGGRSLRPRWKGGWRPVIATVVERGLADGH
jgi:hypothetical protein